MPVRIKTEAFPLCLKRVAVMDDDVTFSGNVKALITVLLADRTELDEYSKEVRTWTFATARKDEASTFIEEIQKLTSAISIEPNAASEKFCQSRLPHLLFCDAFMPVPPSSAKNPVGLEFARNIGAAIDALRRKWPETQGGFPMQVLFWSSQNPTLCAAGGAQQLTVHPTTATMYLWAQYRLKPIVGNAHDLPFDSSIAKLTIARALHNELLPSEYQESVLVGLQGGKLLNNLQTLCSTSAPVVVVCENEEARRRLLRSVSEFDEASNKAVHCSGSLASLNTALEQSVLESTRYVITADAGLIASDDARVKAIWRRFAQQSHTLKRFVLLLTEPVSTVSLIHQLLGRRVFTVPEAADRPADLADLVRINTARTVDAATEKILKAHAEKITYEKLFLLTPSTGDANPFGTTSDWEALGINPDTKRVRLKMSAGNKFELPRSGTNSIPLNGITHKDNLLALLCLIAIGMDGTTACERREFKLAYLLQLHGKLFATNAPVIGQDSRRRIQKKLNEWLKGFDVCVSRVDCKHAVGNQAIAITTATPLDVTFEGFGCLSSITAHAPANRTGFGR
jgi:hypothetical protein